MRAFFAVKIPEDIRQKIDLRFTKRVPKEKFKAVKKENLHITLLFLGEIKEEAAKKLAEKMQAIEAKDFKITLKGAGSFGKNALWAAVSEGKENLAAIHRKLLEITGAPEEKFSAHATFARNLSAGAFEVHSIVEKFNSENFEESFFAEKIWLIESQLGPSGPEYFDFSSKTLSKRA